MEIVKLPRGEQAPKDSDCINLLTLPDGKVQLEASALRNLGEADLAESVALLDGSAYDTAEEAEAAGLAWAESQGVDRLYVSTDA